MKKLAKNTICLAVTLLMGLPLTLSPCFAQEKSEAVFDGESPEVDGTPRISSLNENEDFAGGSGTEEDPYIIENKYQLNNVRNYLDSSFKLNADITFEDSDFADGGDFYNDGAGWIPIGEGLLPIEVANESEFIEFGNKYGCLYYKNSSQYYYGTNKYDDYYTTYYYKEEYNGNFNGNGHCIKNLNLMTKTKYSGLFGVTTGTISDLGIVDCVVNINNTDDMVEFGSVAARAKKIIGCYATGDINIISSKRNGNGRVGGITGYSDIVSECANYAKITVDGDAYVGGIIGLASSNSNSSIQDCYNAGAIKSRNWIGDDGSGGIVGRWQGELFKNSFNVGQVSFPITSSTGGYDLDRLRNLYYLNSCKSTNSYAVKEFLKCSKSYDEMTKPETFQGYDFDDVWVMGDGDHPYPVLRRLKDRGIPATTHEYGEWTVTKQATCTENGTKQRVCTICQREEAEEILALGHDYSTEWTVDKSPTCIETGIKSHHCNRCDSKTDITEIPVTDHIWNETYTIDKYPTSTETGIQSIHCSVCDSIKNGSEIEIPKLTGTWKKDNVGWWYSYRDGTFAKNGIITIDNVKYAFNENGYLATGWYKSPAGEWYYATNNGLSYSWIRSGSAWYYMNPNSGSMVTGLNTIDGSIYYMNSSGAMVTGWQLLNGNWYYFVSSGAAAKGWLRSGSAWYYMNPNSGSMVTGLNTIDGSIYYMNSSGAMVTGWQLLNGNWYYFASSGAAAKGWLGSGSAWYYMNSDGTMRTGWLDDTYYMRSSGAMSVGWELIGADYYYFASSGEKIINAWIGDYYLESDGKMARDTWIGQYYVDADGKWVSGKTR